MPLALAEQEAAATDPRHRQAIQELRGQFAIIAESWADTFIHAVDAHLLGVASEADDADSEDLAMGRAELQAEERYRELLADLDERMLAIQRTLYIPVHVRELAPAGLARALQDTADQLGWPESLPATL